ncbi:MAG: glycosyltransferase family 2 protein [Deltaproteobacteria bacterium]|nr:glycosyltransferase family 2 protein [Deltaproteobacteria bacterium]
MVPRNGFRPRDREARLAVAAAMLGHGEFPVDEDGFAAACREVRESGPRRAGPMVTVLICTYNRLALLPEAVASARAQDWPVEIVVVDDGSTDGTAEWLGLQRDLVVIRQPANRGKPAALEAGMAAATGAAVLVLDDDDLLFPGSVPVLAAALFAHPDAVAAWGDTLVWDHATRDVVDYCVATRVPATHTRRAVLCTIPAMPGATLVRMSAQRDLDPFEPSLVRGQDMDHYLRLSALGPVVTVPLPVLAYRRHDGLRGSAAARWQKHKDPAEHRRRFLACVQPVFKRRWRDSRHGRAEGFAWALGLVERELPADAQFELRRWPPPFSPHEAWVRGRAGLPSVAAKRDVVLVIDDGDDGALEDCMAALPEGVAVEVICPRPRDTVGLAQLFWPGSYRAANVVRATRSSRLALSSSPGWLSPAFDPGELLPLPPADAAYALAAARDWPLPSRERAVRGARLHPFAQACHDAVTRPFPACLAPAMAVIRAHAAWVPGRLLAERLMVGAEGAAYKVPEVKG